MQLRIPVALQDENVKCDVRGLEIEVGQQINSGDYIAELRYEVLSDVPLDCPVVLFGDLIAQAGGTVISIATELTGPMGMVIAEIGEETGDFPVTFETM
ncbi:hypothetical protein [Roseibium suaedae]|uniref:Lipoyl-binding domain-containing protein n=1 Tax=Roseibium suaedae TaxID=735517 RepID=A0A1M7P6W7_9HYPH|nr:hypothetical protein [Roseibium suaedae]SHN12370.1 hypothetical protein SAMN05444272_4155 [Roseibium suaedae]